MAVGGIDRNLFSLIVNRNVSLATDLSHKLKTMLSGLSSQADRRMEIHCDERYQ